MEINIKDGYKVTEVGVIPDDWEVKKLGDIALVSSGGTPNRSNLFYWNGNIPWITTSQIDFNTIITSNEFITELGLKNSSAKMYYQNTLLMAMYGQGKTRGKIGILGIDATINQACAAITINKDVYNNYIFFYLAYNYEEIRKLSNTGNQENLNGNIIKSIFIPLPPLAEQKAIAHALSDVDNLITAIDQLITKKRNLKQGTMQELLTGKKRLPGFSGKWEVKKVGDICDFIVPGRNKPKKFEGHIPWITTPDLEDGRSIYKSRLDLCISIDEAKNVGSKIVPVGSIIMSCAGELGITALTENEIVINQQLHAFIPSSIIDGWFLLNIIKRQKKYINSIATKTAVPYINKDNCNSIPIPLPPLPEQKAIAEILTDMDKEIEALEKNRDKYKTIKQGMMQELLTGKTRIIDN